MTGPGGISCGSAGDACSATVDGGGATLTATADAGYGLESWSGACASATGTSCALALSSATTAGASFGERPACNASATGPADACGAGAYALLSWSGAHGACGADGTQGCGAGRMESHAPPPAAACGSSADSCASGDWRDGTDTAAEQRWSCAGATATETWNCGGSGGDWTWTCAGGGETKSCAGTLDGSSAGCSRQSAGADASCFACTDGHHGHDGSCHADHACGPDQIGGGDRECSGCGDGLVPNASGTACVACPVGRHEDDSAPGSCHADHACGADEIGGGDRECVRCPAGKVPNGRGTACGCPTGEHEHDDHACHAAGHCHGDGDCGDGDVCWNGSCGTRVDGGWTAKSNGDWGSCSATACGESGRQSRSWTRTCTKPVPAHGGADCTGEANGTESRDCAGDSCAGVKVCWGGACETPVDGGWTAKSHGDWGNCSATACGSSGTRERSWSRSCANPVPAFGGADCSGQANGTERRNCAGDSCAGVKVCWGGSCETPVDGGWTEKSYVWSGVCSATACGSSGTESGSWTRSCTRPPPAFGGKFCEGADEGTGSRNCEGASCLDGKVCSAGACVCRSGEHAHGGSCHSTEVCHTDSDCEDGKVCSAGACVCDVGKHAHGGFCHPTGDCHDDGECPDGKSCWEGSCCTRVDGGWSDRTNGTFGGCSATACGSEGTRTRTWSRTCTNPAPRCGGASCVGRAGGTDERNCYGGSCTAGQHCDGSGGSASCHADHVCGPDQIGGGVEECTTCPAGKVPNATRTACEACQFGESQAGTCRTCPTGCSASSCGGANVCQCPGSSCPQLWGQHGNCTATGSKTCSGDTDGCGRRSYSNRCTTGSHIFDNVATESCLYEHRDRNLWRCRHWTRTCRATVTQVGCVYTGVVIPPIDLPFPVASPPDGGYERGYLLAPFQCGSAPDTCRAEIGDEVLEGSEGVEDRDDTDTEHRWACRSDTGEVRECGAENG